MTIKEYFEEWKGFDYFTAMSDDNRVYLRGRYAKSELKMKTGDDPILMDIWRKFCRHDDTLGSSPKPLLEDYLDTMGSEV
jgi:hypothetical protein